MIENCLGSKAIVHGNISTSGKTPNEAPIIEAPGQLSSHYAPRKSLRLNVDSPSDNEYYIALGDAICDYYLSLSMDMDEAASNLFAALR
jgi:L-threonylcarbamoyladenylate synthase